MTADSTTTAEKPPAKPKPPRPSRRPWRSRRLMAIALVSLVLLPIIGLVSAEFVLRARGHVFPTSFLIEKQVDGETRLASNSRYPWVRWPRHLAATPEYFSVPLEKPAGLYRILVLGGSVARGEPRPDFGFARLLEVMLERNFPSTDFDVINAALPRADSGLVAEIARECARLKPDLAILHAGHHEFFGAARRLRDPNANLADRMIERFRTRLHATALGQAIVDWAESRARRKSPDLPRDIYATMIDNPIEPGSPLLDETYQRFELNLASAIQSLAASGAKVVVSTLASNLRHSAPFGSVAPSAPPEAQSGLWADHYETGLDLANQRKFSEAFAELLTAEQIAPGNADIHYWIGKALWGLGQREAARERFIKARDLDTVRLRADSRINEIIRAAADRFADQGVALADAEAYFAGVSPNRTPGAEYFIEHTHLNFPGQWTLARLFLEHAVASLPGPIYDSAPAPPSLLAQATCERLLGYNDWSRYTIASETIERLRTPPFTEQSDLRQTLRRLRILRRAASPALDPRFVSRVERLFDSSIRNRPSDWRIRLNYAQYLFAVHEDAIAKRRTLEEALKIAPGRPLLLMELGDAHFSAGQFVQAHGRLTEALAADPSLARAELMLANVLVAFDLNDEAHGHYLNAERLNPRDSEVQYNLGLSLQKRGEIQAARRHYQLSLKVDPDHAPTHNNLGTALRIGGLAEDALAHFDRAVALEPDNPRYHLNLAQCSFDLGLLDQARAQFKRAHELAPAAPDYANAYGWFLATCSDSQYRDSELALSLALTACRLTQNRRPICLDTLAAAYADSGRMDEAINAARQALGLAQSLGEESLALDIQSRLALYLQGRAYHRPRF